MQNAADWAVAVIRGCDEDRVPVANNIGAVKAGPDIQLDRKTRYTEKEKQNQQPYTKPCQHKHPLRTFTPYICHFQYYYLPRV